MAAWKCLGCHGVLLQLREEQEDEMEQMLVQGIHPKHICFVECGLLLGSADSIGLVAQGSNAEVGPRAAISRTRGGTRLLPWRAENLEIIRAHPAAAVANHQHKHGKVGSHGHLAPLPLPIGT